MEKGIRKLSSATQRHLLLGCVPLGSLSSVCGFCLNWFLLGCVCAEHTILLLPSAHGVFRISIFCVITNPG